MRNHHQVRPGSAIVVLGCVLAGLCFLAVSSGTAKAQGGAAVSKPWISANEEVISAADPEAAAEVAALCVPKILANKELVTPAQRKAAGNIAWPPLTDQADGFAWPDTELGVVKGDGGYVFFGSDGGLHTRQYWEGLYYGNNKYGSITRTIGTLDNPLGTEPPIDVTIHANSDPSVNPYYASYDYMGGGPVYRVPVGMPGAGKLLLVYTRRYQPSQRRALIRCWRWRRRRMGE